MSWWTADLAAVLLAVVKAIVLMLGLVTVAAMLIWVERRLLACAGPVRPQSRRRLRPVAGRRGHVKIFFKEDWIPPLPTNRYF